MNGDLKISSSYENLRLPNVQAKNYRRVKNWKFQLKFSVKRNFDADFLWIAI
jgi:hypothetical protein